MTKTEHYQLNQWDASDRVLREDFNADNAKIDAALEAFSQKSAFVKLKEIATTNAIQQIDVDVSAIDWSHWQHIHIDLALRTNNDVKFYVNDSPTDCAYYTVNSGSTSYSIGQLCTLRCTNGIFTPRLTLTPGRLPNREITVHYRNNMGYTAILFSELRVLNFLCTSNIAADSHIILWGEG